MSYRSVHGRGTDLEIPFLCFRVTLDIASRSPFGIFENGGAADEPQVRARKGHTVNFFVNILLLTLPPGLLLEFLQLKELLMGCRSMQIVVDARARTDVLEG